MKKLVLMLAVVFGMAVVSCGNKGAEATAEDTTAVDAVEVVEEVVDTVAADSVVAEVAEVAEVAAN